MPEYVDIAVKIDIKLELSGQLAVSTPPTPPPPGYGGNVLTATPALLKLPFDLDRFGRPI